jgi:hypothetical protein
MMARLWEREELRKIYACGWSWWRRHGSSVRSSNQVSSAPRNGTTRETRKRSLFRRRMECRMLMVEAVRACAAHRVSAQCVLRNVGVNVTCRQRNGCAGTAEEVSRKREPRKECWICNLKHVDLMAYKQRRFLRSSSRGRLIANTVDTRSNVTKERLISMQALYEQRIKWRNVVGGPYRRSSFVAGTTSVNVERWNKALETIGVPKCKWTQVRERFMRVLLEEHDTILRSYRAQKS